MELKTFPGFVPALCLAEDTLVLLSSKSHKSCILPQIRVNWPEKGAVEKGIAPAHDICRFTMQMSTTFRDSAPVFSIGLCKGLFICNQWRCLRLSTHACSYSCQLVAICWSACTSPWFSLSLSEHLSSGLGSSLLSSSSSSQ